MSAEFPELIYLIDQLQPQNRRRLARALALKMRAEASTDILKNIDAEGHSMVARINKKRGKMFQKMGQRRSMRIRANADRAEVTFTDKNRTLAKVHQFGWRSKVNDKKKVKYPERTLLGFNRKRNQMLEAVIIDHLGGN